MFEPTGSWYKYRDLGVGALTIDGELKLQIDPEDAEKNGHIYCVNIDRVSVR